MGKKSEAILATGFLFGLIILLLLILLSFGFWILSAYQALAILLEVFKAGILPHLVLEGFTLVEQLIIWSVAYLLTFTFLRTLGVKIITED